MRLDRDLSEQGVRAGIDLQAQYGHYSFIIFFFFYYLDHYYYYSTGRIFSPSFLKFSKVVNKPKIIMGVVNIFHGCQPDCRVSADMVERHGTN